MNMHDLGRLSETEVVQAMQNADAFLFPSRSEGFGLVVAEAMACGLPVIGIQGSSVAELVTQGVTGRLCAHDDVLGMAEAARGLAGQRRLLAAQSLAARETAETRFEIQLMLDAYINTYSVATGACS